MAGARKVSRRGQNDIVRDLREERERMLTALDVLGDELTTAADDVRERARQTNERARQVAPAVIAGLASLLLFLKLARDGRRRRR